LEREGGRGYRVESRVRKLGKSILIIVAGIIYIIIWLKRRV
jgi:hypothetical protein